MSTSPDSTTADQDSKVAGEQAAEPERDVRSRLLMAAGPVFANSGFDRASLREICREASVNVASVAYYFGDKMGLYRAVVDQIREDRIERFPAPTNTSELSPEVALTRLVHTMLSRMLTCDDSAWESQLMMREMNHPTVVFQALVNEVFRPVFVQLQDVLKRLVDAPVADHVIDQLALSAVGQCLYYRVGRGVVDMLVPQESRNDHFHIDALCEHIVSVIISAAENEDFAHQKTQIANIISEFAAPDLGESDR